MAVAQTKEAEKQRHIAEAQREEAAAQREKAPRTQSLFLDDLSSQQTAAGNATNGILLALEGLPSNMANPDR